MFNSICKKIIPIFVLSMFISSSIFAFNHTYIKPSTKNYPEIIGKFYGLSSTKNFTLLNLPGYQQTTIYTCGPSAVMNILHYYGKLNNQQMNKNTEMHIAKELGTSLQKGTSPQAIANWFEKNGFNVTYGENGTIAMLQDNLKKGIPTIVEWVDWSGHWVVVTGYNKEGQNSSYDKDTIFLADSVAHLDSSNTINGLIATNAARFNYMWFDVKYFNPGHIVKNVYVTVTPKKQI